MVGIGPAMSGSTGSAGGREDVMCKRYNDDRLQKMCLLPV